MEKESYNIDDILSEVKKRREENERSLKNSNENFILDDKNISETEEKPEEIELKLENELEPEEKFQETELVLEEQEEIVEENSPENTDFQQIEEEAETVVDEKDSDSDVVTDNQPKNNDGMVDLLSLAENPIVEAPREVQPKDEKKKKDKKKNKTFKAIIIILVVLIVAAGIFAAVYANNMLNKITDNKEADPYEMVTYYEGMDFLQEDFPTIDEVSASEIQGYRDYLKQWYQNGDPVSSTHILNVLLIGEDTREEKISNASRADSAIIASINVDTGEIHLTSILRDMFVYYEVDGEGYYGKINESASRGGMQTYIKTIERYYKIAINNYAVVNFASFPKIIDALGGVNINITSREIYEINNHPKRYGGVTITKNFDGEEGKMTLNGKQALAYCRIRKIDSDGARANRQKTVLMAIFKKAKSAGAVDTVKIVNKLAQYVYTGYSKKELIEIGNTALKDGWLSYEIKTSNVPSVENCKGGQKFSAAPGYWIWLADIPKDAYEFQMRVYGKSNINLNENRADYIALGR